MHGIADPPDHFHLHRLDEVMIEARLPSEASLLGLAPAGHGDQRQVATGRTRSQDACNFVPAHARHADIEEDDVGLEFGCNLADCSGS